MADQFVSPDRRGLLRRQDDRRQRRKDRELEAARRISGALFEHLTPDELIGRALRTALEVVEAESGSILIADPASQQLIFRHSIGESPVKTGTVFPWDQGIAGTVFQTGEPLIIRNAKQDARHLPAIDELTSHTTRDMIAIALKRWEGEPIGVLEVLNKREGLLDEDDVAILSIVSAIAASSIEQARLYEEAKMAEVTRLLGDISHDIKNMLMPVVCGAGLMHEELKDLLGDALQRGSKQAKESFDRCNEVVEMVENSTRRIQDRVKEISDCVKGLSTAPEFAPCRLDVVVNDVTETLKWSADKKGISIQTADLEKMPIFVADERRLFNAFYNLINNAIPEVAAGGKITVTAREDPMGLGLHIMVVDTGKGMPPNIRDRLFTAGAKSSKQGGTGLGTKIVKDVVDAHHGKITVDSQLGVGTTFHIHLPLQPPKTSIP